MANVLLANPFGPFPFVVGQRGCKKTLLIPRKWSTSKKFASARQVVIGNMGGGHELAESDQVAVFFGNKREVVKQRKGCLVGKRATLTAPIGWGMGVWYHNRMPMNGN